MPPPVSILLPVLNELDHIDEVLESLAKQDYEGEIEIVVADGGSSDGTLARLSRWEGRLPGLVVVDNPHRAQSYGLNTAARRASGEILVRADGHTLYAPDYVRRSVEALHRTGATAVGGNLKPRGQTAFGQAVESVMTSPLAIGPGKFHHADEIHEVDTVYLGAFLKADLERLGGYRHLPSGVAEDADLYYRWRQQGARIVLDPSIRSTYRPRGSLPAFLRQSWRYGVGKAEMLYLNRRFPSWRPLAPLALVVGLLCGLVLGIVVDTWWPLLAGIATWWALILFVALRAAARTISVAAAVATMHLAYGAGLLFGILRGPAPVRHVS